MEILEAVCANCELVSTITNAESIMTMLYDFATKQSFQVKKLALMSLSNIVLAGEEEQILPIAFKTIDCFTRVLGDNYDLDLNIIILKALMDIFSYG